MITIPIIITRPSDINTIDWPEDSQPLYWPSASVGPVMFPESRFITDAKLEEISFMKLQGFTVMEAPGETVIFQDNKYIMSERLLSTGIGLVKVNAV